MRHATVSWEPMESDFLSAILGPDGMSQTESGRLVVTPSTPEELGSVVKSSGANSKRIHLLDASTGTLGRDAPPSSVPGVSLSRMNGIHHVDAPNRVASIQAGISHENLVRALAEEGLQWPVDPLGGQVSVAATVVNGLALVHSAGLPDLRHWILGSRWLLGRGTFLASGGKTIKNSAGYDMTRALVGMLGYIAIPIDFQLRIEAMPQRRMTGKADAQPGLVEAMLRNPQGVESIHLTANGGAGALAHVSIGGSEKHVDSAIDGLREFNIQWIEERGGRHHLGEPFSMQDRGSFVKWTAGPVTCERIVNQISQDLPDHAVFAAPLGRWGIASSPDPGRVDEIISENGGKASIWPPDYGDSAEHGNAGFDEFRRAFDPDGVLV